MGIWLSSDSHVSVDTITDNCWFLTSKTSSIHMWRTLHEFASTITPWPSSHVGAAHADQMIFAAACGESRAPTYPNWFLTWSCAYGHIMALNFDVVSPTCLFLPFGWPTRILVISPTTLLWMSTSLIGRWFLTAACRISTNNGFATMNAKPYLGLFHMSTLLNLLDTALSLSLAGCSMYLTDLKSKSLRSLGFLIADFSLLKIR